MNFNLNFRFVLVVFYLFLSSTSINHPQAQDDSVPLEASTGQPPTATNSIGKASNNDKLATEFRANEALESIRDWASRFGRDVHYGTQEATCLRTIRDQFDPAKSDPSRRGQYKASVVSIDWTRLHGDIVRTISNTMGWHKSAVENIARAAEYFAGNHSYDKNLRFDYVDVHRLQNSDDEFMDSGASYTGEEINPAANETLPLPQPDPESADLEQPSGNNQEIGQLDSTGQLIPQSTAKIPSSAPIDNENLDGQLEPEQLPKPSELIALQSQSDLQQLKSVNQVHEEQSNAVNEEQQTTTPASGTDPSFQGEWETPIRYLKLSKHPNFDVLINTEESAVHVPVHIYPGDPQVINGIAWSDQLTKVFRDNFVRNPKLTNQYFASQLGFLRLFPAQKWQIARTDPDLYDARMRPWYVAGASSRKDVVILVDSSGSMTGSRRDIAKGVVFEILDTLTDNDHFLIMKFSDVIEQVGVPKCEKMRLERKLSSIPLKNTLFPPESLVNSDYSLDGSNSSSKANETDISSFYLVPATGRNIRHIKTNFTISTSGIANFSHALVTAFEVLRNYQDHSDRGFGSQCNQAIMLITDGSPSDFEDIFNRYNYPNAPVRVFTYLIGRESNDGANSKMMACHNRGYYTHVINLAEVRETVQQYIPVMARPLVLNGTHPISWSPAYGELTYQILTDWIWESKRRDKARAILASSGRGSPSNNQAGGSSSYVPDIRINNEESNSLNALLDPTSIDDVNFELKLEEEIDAIDLFGYNENVECFWQTKQNDLLTTVVQPVYDRKNESVITEKFLVKNIWTVKETVMRTAQILGVAAADMKINDIISLAPSHKLGANGYAIMLTNNGLVMHHPNLRSILEPFNPNDPSERQMRILKPFFSSLDFTQVEHILNSHQDDPTFIGLRNESVLGLTGWRELLTKRTIDCQKRVQSRRQSFYYKPIQQFPFSFMISIPQPYGSHRLEAQIEIKSANLPEKLTTYFTTSDFDLWTVHPDYQYCDGPANNTIATLLDMFQRIESQKLDDIQWRPAESSKPPLYLPGKIVCDKDLVQSLVYDAVATFGFSESCSQPDPSAESSLLGMFGVRFSFIATRSGLTRVRHFDANDLTIKKEALAFARKHARAVDETFYQRTVDYNMLVNDSATLIQVPFITHKSIRDRFQRWEMEQMMNYNDNLAAQLETQPNSGGNSNADSTPDPTLINDNSYPSASKLSVRDMSLMEKLEILTNSSLHIVASQSIIVNEGTQRAMAGVTGVFYDYASFVTRFFNSTNAKFQGGKPLTKAATCYTGTSTDEMCDEARMKIKCGQLNDTIDCLLIDNNGYIIVSEDLDFIGRHLKSYEPIILQKLVAAGAYHAINITDYQSVCMKHEEKEQPTSSSGNRISTLAGQKLYSLLFNLALNALTAITYSLALLSQTVADALHLTAQFQGQSAATMKQLAALQPMLSLLPNKTYLRPCERILTRYETRPATISSNVPEYYTTRCGCDAWFVYEQVPKTNLIMLIVDSSPNCRYKCDQVAQLDAANQVDPSGQSIQEQDSIPIDGTTETQVCSMLERENSLYRKRLDSCFSHHPDEEHIKICGSAATLPVAHYLLATCMLISIMITVQMPVLFAIQMT